MPVITGQSDDVVWLAIISYSADHSVILGVFSTEDTATEAVNGYAGDPGFDLMVYPVTLDVEVDIDV